MECKVSGLLNNCRQNITSLSLLVGTTVNLSNLIGLSQAVVGGDSRTDRRTEAISISLNVFNKCKQMLRLSKCTHSILNKNSIPIYVDLCKSPTFIFFFILKIFMKYISLHELLPLRNGLELF